jgi:hypothetical protein
MSGVRATRIDLVLSGGDGAIALEPVDAEFHGVPLLVLLLVEG